jgi:aspartyl-tRNA(Asn)/glutamyl-tRNA(Gln) amidotransferase subunit C
MSINRDQVIRVAKLARLSFTDAEIDQLTVQLGNVLELANQLNQVDTTDIEPMVHAIELTNAVVPDQLGVSLSREAALQNAPEDDGECFLVPAVL